MSEFVCPSCGVRLQVTMQQPTKEPYSIEKARALFPKDLGDMLTFEEDKDSIVIKPNGYLGSDNFSRIVHIIRGVGGEYISAGKESHFKIPRA